MMRKLQTCIIQRHLYTIMHSHLAFLFFLAAHGQGKTFKFLRGILSTDC